MVAAVFAILAYLCYLFAIVSYSPGHAAAAGLSMAIEMQFGFIVWIAGVAAGVILAVIVLRFNLDFGIDLIRA